MALFVQRILDGVADGSLYGALALALVIVYQGTGRLNLAQGEMATLGTYVALVLSTPATPALAGTMLVQRWLPLVPWPPVVAIVAALVLSAALGALIERLVVRRALGRPVAVSVRLTVALLILGNAWTTMTWSGRTRQATPVFPTAPADYLPVLGARLRYETVGMWSVLVAMVVLLWVLSRRTRAGLAFRAVAQSPGNSVLVGIRVSRVWMTSWALAAAIGSLVGILSASRLVLTPGMMVRLLVFGFVAAAIGGFSSPVGALLGGLAVGLVQSMVGGYASAAGESLSFPVVVVAMIVLLAVRPSGLFAAVAEPAAVAADPGGGRAPEPSWRSATVRHRADSPSRWWRGGRLALVAVGAVVALAPAWWLPGIHGRTWVLLVGTTVAFAGLAAILGPAGELSLGHAAFMGLGAYTVGITTGRYGLHPMIGLAVAALVGVAVGLIVGFPALRIRGQYLAVVTFAVAVVLPSLITLFRGFTGGDVGPPLIAIPAGPSWFPDGGKAITWFHVVSLVVAAVVLVGLQRVLGGPWGRALRASTANATAATSMGVDVAGTRTAAFALATGLAALGGAMVAVPSQAVTGGQLDPFRSLAAFALVMLCGVDSLVGPALAAVLYIGTPWLLTTTGWALGAQGVAPDATGGGAYLLWGLALLIGTLLAPDGIVATVRRVSVRRR